MKKNPTTGAVIKGLAIAAATEGLGSALAPVLGSTALGKAGAGAISNVAVGGCYGILYLPFSGNGWHKLGGMLAENFGVATNTVNIVPTNVVGGFVQSATNELVSNAITEGKLDIEGAVVSGLIGAGVNAASDLLSDASNNSIEAEMKRIQDDTG